MNSSYYVDTSYGLSSTTGLFGALAGMMAFIWIIVMVIGILQIVAMWKIFVKAGKPGWVSIIPIYNIIVMCEIAEKEWWYILLMCIPLVNIYAMFVIYNEIAKKFGKGVGFTIGMILLPFVFFMILGFGKDSVYNDTSLETETSNIVSNNSETQEASSIYSEESSSSVVSGQNVVQDSNVYMAPVFDTVMQPQTPVMNEPVTPVMEQAPVMNEPVTPVMEQAPVMNEPVTPVMEQAPVMNEPVTPVMEQTASTSNQEVNMAENTDQHTSLWSNNNQ